ncbi:DNA polymerase delta, subunit 4-domain-containing protein [Trametes elegans]|nr:DNA polymerase delta, subunit 4-domain-containing protein [Trametes elegans]
MPPQTRARTDSSSRTPAMKQAKLSFTSKRTSSSAAGKQAKPQKALSRRASSIPTAEPINISDSESDVSFNDEYISPATKKRRLNAPRHKVTQRADEDCDEEQAPSVPQPQREKLNTGDKRWRKQFGLAREKMGYLPPVHGEGQSMVHHILRVFDLSYEYGPCVGVSRLDRWERAHALGLNPPPEVKEILMTQESSTDAQFSQSVFHGEV